jgi:hypothetical protein
VSEDWEPTRWWRVTYADGRVYAPDHPHLAGYQQIWCETSNEAEARKAVASCPSGGVLLRLFEHRATEWREES